MYFGDITALLDMCVKSEQYVNKTHWYGHVNFVFKLKEKDTE